MLRRFPRVRFAPFADSSISEISPTLKGLCGSSFVRMNYQEIRLIENHFVSGNSGPFHVRSFTESRETGQETDYQNIFADLSMAEKCSLMFPPDIPDHSMSQRYDALSEEQIKGRWQNLDPVDMESIERDHFLKTGQVLRSRYVQAKPSLAIPGARLRQYLALDVLDKLETLSVQDLGMFLSLIGSISDPNALFHRDLKFDAQFKICKKLLTLRDDEFASIIAPTCVALNKFDPHSETPNRVWRRKVIPVIRRSLVDEGIAKSIDSSTILPVAYRGWNSQMIRGIIVSHLLSSGRIRPSNRIISHLKKFLGNTNTLSPECLTLIEQGSHIAGIGIM